jgi:hypothetical protein
VCEMMDVLSLDWFKFGVAGGGCDCLCRAAMAALRSEGHTEART